MQLAPACAICGKPFERIPDIKGPMGLYVHIDCAQKHGLLQTMPPEEFAELAADFQWLLNHPEVADDDH